MTKGKVLSTLIKRLTRMKQTQGRDEVKAWQVYLPFLIFPKFLQFCLQIANCNSKIAGSVPCKNTGGCGCEI
jgi:hypothetical protein